MLDVTGSAKRRGAPLSYEHLDARKMMQLPVFLTPSSEVAAMHHYPPENRQSREWLKSSRFLAIEPSSSRHGRRDAREGSRRMAKCDIGRSTPERLSLINLSRLVAAAGLYG